MDVGLRIAMYVLLQTIDCILRNENHELFRAPSSYVSSHRRVA